LAGRFDEAKAARERALELEPGFHINIFIQAFTPIMRPELVSALAAGLRQTGLPE
jgi:hypothetical protein